jgi:hypothetical protein
MTYLRRRTGYVAMIALFLMEEAGIADSLALRTTVRADGIHRS